MINYQEFLTMEFWGNTGQDYLNALILLIGLIIFFKIFQVVVLNRLNKLAKETETDVDNLAIQLIKDIKPPFYFIIALYISLRFLSLNNISGKIVDAVFVIAITYQIIKVINRIIDFVTGKIISKETDGDTQKDVEAIGLISKIIKAGIWVVGILIVLSNLGVNVTSLIAGLGIGGIAVALAVQNILSDVFSSVSIFIDKPFKVGDFIVIGGKDSGTVKKIGIKTTRIKTLQGEEMVISNKDLTSERVQNFRRMEKRRVAFSLGVIYGTPSEKLKRIPEMVKSVVEKIEGVKFGRTHFQSYGDSSLDFEIVYFVQSSDYDKYMDVQQEINLGIYDQFNKENIEFAYPTQTLFIKKD